jgi:UDP-3-O-[3-hydroxymyristoyl] glucosamine N-acyltransferase
MARLDELAALVGAECKGPGDREISGVASLIEATPEDISFFHNQKYLGQLARTRAGAVLVPTEHDVSALPTGPVYLAVENPSMAFATVVGHFTPPQPPVKLGVHPRAVIEEGAILDPEAVSVGPGAVISNRASIGKGSVIGANVFVGEGVQIGENCHFHPGVAIRENCRIGDRVIIHCNSVIGADGFGYELVEGIHRKIDQVGIVQIDNDVEIGAATTIDRARFGRTWIGEGTKIDNQVQIGHNCVIGKHCIIVSHTGIAGSVAIGDYVVIAAKVGIAGHLRICDKVVLMAQAGITKDITEPGYYMGFPAGPASQIRRDMVAARSIPSILERLRNLEKSCSAGK